MALLPEPGPSRSRLPKTADGQHDAVGLRGSSASCLAFACGVYRKWRFKHEGNASAPRMRLIPVAMWRSRRSDS